MSERLGTATGLRSLNGFGLTLRCQNADHTLQHPNVVDEGFDIAVNIIKPALDSPDISSQLDSVTTSVTTAIADPAMATSIVTVAALKASTFFSSVSLYWSFYGINDGRSDANRDISIYIPLDIRSIAYDRSVSISTRDPSFPSDYPPTSPPCYDTNI